MTRSSGMSEETDSISSPIPVASESSGEGDSRPSSRDSERPNSKLSGQDDIKLFNRPDCRGSKLKKRVSFHTDENLVSIREIPPRSDSPMSEEMEPCDPKKLVADMEHSTKFGQSSKKYDYSKSTGRSLDLVAQITGMNMYGTSLSRSVGKMASRQLSSQTSKKTKDTQTIAEKATRRRVTVKQFSTDDIGDNKLRIGLPKTDKEKPVKTGKRYIGSATKKEREKSRKHKLSSPNEGNAKSRHKVYSFEPQSGVSNSTVTSKNRHKQISIDASNLQTGMSLRFGPEVVDSLPKVHSSPYRQSYQTPACANTNAAGQKQRPSSTPSFGHVIDSGFIFPNDTSHALRVKSAGEKPQIINIDTRTTNKNKQKVYAWQIANGAQVESPCISQMWDLPKVVSIDSVKTS